MGRCGNGWIQKCLASPTCTNSLAMACTGGSYRSNSSPSTFSWAFFMVPFHGCTPWLPRVPVSCNLSPHADASGGPMNDSCPTISQTFPGSSLICVRSNSYDNFLIPVIVAVALMNPDGYLCSKVALPLYKISNPSGSRTLYPLNCALHFSVVICDTTCDLWVSLSSLSPRLQCDLH